MICYPAAQAKAQREVDTILQGRLPEFSDEDSLPYVSAVVKEVLRYYQFLLFKEHPLIVSAPAGNQSRPLVYRPSIPAWKLFSPFHRDPTCPFHR